MMLIGMEHKEAPSVSEPEPAGCLATMDLSEGNKSEVVAIFGDIVEAIPKTEANPAFQFLVTEGQKNPLEDRDAVKCSSPTDFFDNFGPQQEIAGISVFDLEKSNAGEHQVLDKSPLLHESSKDVALCSANQVQEHAFLEDPLSASKDSAYAVPDATEMADELFAASLNDGVAHHLEETKDEAILDSTKKDQAGDAPKHEDPVVPAAVICAKPLVLQQSGEHKILVVNKLPLASSDNEGSGADVSTQTVALPIVDGRFASEMGVPLAAVDVKILPLLTLESLLLGNFAVLPAHTSSIKLQVVQDDGTIKRVNVTPICKSDEAPGGTSEETKTAVPNGTAEAIANRNGTTTTNVSASDVSRPFKCELCSATFNRLGNYTRHKKIHTAATKEDHRFRCEVCSKSFIQRCDLTRHMHIHSGTEPHRCTLCGKGYIRHSDLVTHQRFHNKEKPFSCPHCSKGFSQRGDLNRHLRSIHLQVKPLSCAHCHKKFAKEATLLRHMQISHRDVILKSLNDAPQEDKAE